MIISPGLPAGFRNFSQVDQATLALLELFGPSVLAYWRLYEPWLSLNATAITSANDFSANPPWVPSRVTTPTANQVKETATTGIHSLSEPLLGSVGPIVSMSVDVESVGGRVAVWGLSNANAEFDPATLTVGVTASCTASILDLGGGRARCAVYPTIPWNGTATVALYVKENLGGGYSYAGDITKGLNAYNAQIDQRSIASTPNLLNPGTYDLVNATKASQPVLGATAWGGVLPAGVFSAANLLTANALAAPLTGTDIPWAALATAEQIDTATNYNTILSLGNSATGQPLDQFRMSNILNCFQTLRRNTLGTVTRDHRSVAVPAAARYALANTFDGAHGRHFVNGTLDAGSPFATSVGASAYDRFTVGALGTTAYAGHFNGHMREIVIVKAAITDAQAAAASRILQRQSPLV